MSGKPTKPPVTNAMVKKSLYLSHFTPSMMPPETLEAMLVQREPVLSRCLASVVESLRTGSRHHTLFVGPRGIGKTHLISLLHHRLSKTKEAKSKALIAWMREEEWGVTSFFELVLRILRTLDASYPALNIEAQTVVVYDLPLQEAEKKAESILLETIGDKCLVVLLENLDDLFEQIGDQGQKAWRAFIQNHSNTILVCTTPSLFTGVTIQKSAFYGFFDVEPLTELSYEDVVNLLAKIAIEREDKPLALYIQTPEGRARIRAVHHLAEGNPRIYIIFAQFLTQESLDDLVQAFMHTLDELTPYYQARIKELSGQQRKILEHLINYTGAASVKQLAKSCFITQQVCSSQLRQLRLKRYVRVIEQGRESYYELSEPLMRLCMDIKKQRGEPVGLLVEMLRIWYTEDQLSQWLERPNQDFNLSIKYLQKALKLVQEQRLEPNVKAVLKDLQIANKSNEQVSLILELVDLQTKNSRIQQIQSLIRMALSEKYPVENLSRKEIEKYIQDIIQFVVDVMPKVLKSSDAYDLLSILFLASNGVFRFDPSLATPIFKALLAQIARFPAAASVAIFNVLALRQVSASDPFDWCQSLLRTHPDGLVSKDITSVIKRISRISKATLDVVVNKDRSGLISLPKEERILVDVLIQKHPFSLN
jgi:DNA polymerase III delta prime subunit